MEIWVFVTLIVLGAIFYRMEVREYRKMIKEQREALVRLAGGMPIHTTQAVANNGKPDRTVYAAWGNQMINIDEDERQ